MAGGWISTGRILERLDEYLDRDDYASAERHLRYWLAEAESRQDVSTELLMRNELMGLCRKLGKQAEAVGFAETALEKIETLGIGHQVGAATTLLNCATVYKAFGMAERALPLFERARGVYETELAADDSRLGGLYNNMGLALVDVGRFSEAKELYRKAIALMERDENGAPEAAITYLNLASAAEAEYGLAESDETVQDYLDRAETLLEGVARHDGSYAFVCEKCATVFGYYGRFAYAEELTARARRIYSHEGT
ncbi:MAG: tetratricopeptide repeat protein [Clostridia bacterium]|nr:tetratricopeptide repeat protein [Clostridia bacterium]